MRSCPISAVSVRPEEAGQGSSSDRKELFKTLRRKDAERSDAEPIMAKLDETFLKMDRNFLDLRFRVKEQVSSAEWAEIVARPNGQ